MNKTYKKFAHGSVMIACLAGLNGPLLAESATDTTTPTTEPVTTLEKFTVSEVPLDEQILPTVRPIGSVLGDGRSILDTPRAVTSVNKAWMDDRQVKDAMDFGQFSPGVYSAAQYGIPATPQIRGDLGELYVDGQRTNFSRNSVFPSFNGVEALDIVKGPGSAVYGPQGEGPGGYVNLVTKAPYFDAQHTTISTTFGYWTSGRSYWNPEATIDTGGPINDKLAYRTSYLARYGDGYYINQKNETQDIFTALSYRPSKTVSLDWWGQFYSSRFNEVTGANRVTQQFIDNGTYVGGKIAAGPDPFGGGVVDGTDATLNPATAYTVELPAYKALLGSNDSARGKRFQTQLKATAEISPDFKIVNLVYYEDRKSRKYETYGYDEFVPKDQSFQERLELHKDFNSTGIANKVIAGGDFRYSRLISYQDFTNEPFFAYDLYQDLSGVFYPGYIAQGKTFGSGLQVPGQPGYSGQIFFNTGGNQDTHIYDYAAFLQDELVLSKKASLIGGLRFDRIDADTASPSLVEVFDTETGASFNPGIPLAKGTFFKASDTETDPSYFASLTFKASETRSFYFTYNRVFAITGSANFGGVNVGADFSGSAATYHDELVQSIKAKGTLYEAGYKESFLKNTLYFASALFQQTRLRPQIVGPATVVKTSGLELEAVYQPSKKFSINANMTYQEATEFATFLYEQTGNYLDGYPTTITVDGKPGTGKGSPNFGGYPPPLGKVRAAGVPGFMANAFATYAFTPKFGMGLGPQIQGRQHANQEGTLNIPVQFQWDGFVYYREKHWDVQVSVKNILNDRLLDPIDVGFAGNDTVYVRPPISAAVTFRYKL